MDGKYVKARGIAAKAEARRDVASRLRLSAFHPSNADARNKSPKIKQKSSRAKLYRQRSKSIARRRAQTGATP